MPLLSILLPYYNATATLDRAVESIVQQTFRDWELLLIDNGSTDGSAFLAEKWHKSDSRVKLTSCLDRGIAYALNHGLSLADSPLIARMDADDWSHRHRLEKQAAFLHKHEEIGVVSSQTAFNSTAEKSEGYKYFVEWQNNILSPEEHFVNRFKESPIPHPSVMFRRELIDLYGDYSTDPIPEDYELWLRWMEAGVRFAKVPELLLTWHDDVTRLSRTHSNYSEEAFFKVKGQYLARWMEQHLDCSKAVVACGTSKACRQRAHWLMAEGARIDYLTDVVERRPAGFRFLSHQEVDSPQGFVVLNLIGKRGVDGQVEDYFICKGFIRGKHLLSLA